MQWRAPSTPFVTPSPRRLAPSTFSVSPCSRWRRCLSPMSSFSGRRWIRSAAPRCWSAVAVNATRWSAGGQLVEVFRDRALSLPPLSRTLARRMMEQTRIFRALGGVRGQAPVPLAALEDVLVRFSELIVDHPWIQELDINPLLAAPSGL